ncbi:MAG: hypothetical protein GW798_04510 [Roseovarius sp.]|nr:hypothetical protein [Roseovarius sp.]
MTVLTLLPVWRNFSVSFPYTVDRDQTVTTVTFRRNDGWKANHSHMKGTTMTPENDLHAMLSIEETCAAANALEARIKAIEDLPHGPLRARICATAFIVGGYQMMRLLEGDEATARQLRRLADMIDAQNQGAH